MRKRFLPSPSVRTLVRRRKVERGRRGRKARAVLSVAADQPKETAGQRCATAPDMQKREAERNNKITSLIHECKREQSHHVICNCSLNEKEGLSWKRRKVGVQKQRKIESAREREREAATTSATATAAAGFRDKENHEGGWRCHQ